MIKKGQPFCVIFQMVQVEHTTEDAKIIYELTEEEEKLGLKFVDF